MIAVIFEALPRPDLKRACLDAAAVVRPRPETFDGFISIERFENPVSPGGILSVSYWRDEEAVRRWKTLRLIATFRPKNGRVSARITDCALHRSFGTVA